MEALFRFAVLILLCVVAYGLYLKIAEHFKAKQQVSAPIAPTSLYQSCRAEYEDFSVFVWRCLAAIHGKYGLAVPAYPVGIHSAELSDRVTLCSGQYSFRYEISRDRDVPVSGGMAAVARNRASTDDIKRAFENNLPALMDGGFYFSGHVDVFELDSRRIRVEVHGVSRQLPLTGDIMI